MPQLVLVCEFLLKNDARPAPGCERQIRPYCFTAKSLSSCGHEGFGPYRRAFGIQSRIDFAPKRSRRPGNGRGQPREAQMNILTVNLVLSTIVFAIAAKLYLIPELARLEPRTVVLPILLLHALRHLGLMFLAPPSIRASPSNSHTRRPSATSSPPCWRSSQLPQSSAGRSSRDRSSASSTSRGRLI